MVKKTKITDGTESTEKQEKPAKAEKVKVVHKPMEETVFDASKHFFPTKNRVTDEIRKQIEDLVTSSSSDAEASLGKLLDSGAISAMRSLRVGQVSTGDYVVGRVTLMCSNDGKVERVEIE